MSRSSAFRKTLSLVFISLYLVFGGAVGHCFVWCAEPGEVTHLEFNLAGACGYLCEPSAAELALHEPGDVSFSQPCEDLTLKSYFSEASSFRSGKLFSTPQFVEPPTDYLQVGAFFSPPKDLPTFRSLSDRPPDVAYLTIRTTVLRH